MTFYRYGTRLPTPIPRIPGITGVGGFAPFPQVPTPVTEASKTGTLPTYLPSPAPPPAPIPQMPTPTAPMPLPTPPVQEQWAAEMGLTTQPVHAPGLPWYRGQPTGLEDWAAGQQLGLLRLLNELLPYFGTEDIPDVARYLYGAIGGSEGPFAGYLGATGFAAPQGVPRESDWSMLQRARLVTERAGLEPGTRDWIMGAIDMGLDLTRRAPGERFQRTREQQLRLEQQLEQYLSAPPSDEARPWAQWLGRLVLPTRMYPQPGAVSYTPGTRRGYTILPNPRFY